jgi:hypothetical protein
MSVSFALLKANGHSFDPLPGHDDRKFSLSNPNAADVLHALGIEPSLDPRIERAKTSLIAAFANGVTKGQAAVSA